MFWNLPVYKPSQATLIDLADVIESNPGTSEENDNLPAGFTYLGQFVDHDITHDASTSLERMSDPDALVNFRTPRFDLDSLYGRGPVETPFLYRNKDLGSPDEGFELLSGFATDKDNNLLRNQDDLPRNVEDVALIGDPRNDENTFVSQLHLLFVKFHNKVVREVKAKQGLEGDELFKEAQRVVRWHYQWVVVHDYVRRLVPEDVFSSILTTDENGFARIALRFYDPTDHPYMPVEFAVAAFRFGHSQVRDKYDLNEQVRGVDTFLPDSRLPADPQSRRLADFRGFRALPGFWQPSWPFFFEIDGRPQMSNKIHARLASPLHKLPREPEGDRSKASLALRNLNKGSELSLPSGEWVARAMGEQPLDSEHTRGKTPLWFYILEEANAQQGGRRLGAVGGRIVAEVLLGLLDSDPLSYISVQPNWTPELTVESSGEPVNSMANLIRYADPNNAVRHEGISR